MRGLRALEPSVSVLELLFEGELIDIDGLLGVGVGSGSGCVGDPGRGISSPGSPSSRSTMSHSLPFQQSAGGEIQSITSDPCLKPR